jgi:hypothetical protein
LRSISGCALTSSPSRCETRAGQEAHYIAVEACMHPVTVEFDFVQPLLAFRRRVDELSELRRDPFRQSGTSCYGMRHGRERGGVIAAASHAAL